MTREVSAAEGNALAEEFCYEFIESSAKIAMNINEPFYNIVRALRGPRGRRAPGRPQMVKVGTAPKRGSKAGLFHFTRHAFRRFDGRENVNDQSTLVLVDLVHDDM